MTAFTPHPFWRGSHRMTIGARLRRRRFGSMPAGQARYFQTAPDTRVLAHCDWQPDRTAHPVLVVLHGLEGSSEAPYVRGLGLKAFESGFNVVRLNHRNCGGTEHETPTLYHSGLTTDAWRVVRALIDDGFARIVVAGYSLGGNVALKLAGELGDAAPRELCGVAAVSAPIDLTQATRLLERPGNIFYQWYFLWSLKRRIRVKARLFPDVYSTSGLRRVHSVRAFDDRYTAPQAGFKNAADYYDRASSIHVIPRIAVPTLIVSSLDDPFIPPAPFRDPRVTSNPLVQVLLPAHGGHCGFVSRACEQHDGFWAEWVVASWARARPDASATQAVDGGQS